MTIYKRNCNTCGKYYEGGGKKYCSYRCRPSSMKGKHKTLSDGTWYPKIPSLCLCGCNEITWNGKEYLYKHYVTITDFSGDKNPFFGKHHTPESIENIRKSHKRENLSLETIEKMKISNSGRKHTKEWKEQNSLRMSGSGNPMCGVSSPMKGIKGKEHPAYIDGRSKSNYCEKWTPQLRESFRFRDSYICQLCGRIQDEQLKEMNRILAVHHVHYDKKNCYPDCITLCVGCNSKVNKPSERNNYESFFMNKLNERNLLFWTRRMIK